MSSTFAGQVYAHVGQPFDTPSYDVVIIGAGRMGSLLAHFLLHARPQLRVLLLDQGGLPNEEGASILAPGVWSALDVAAVPPALLPHAQLTRDLVLGRLTAEQGGLGQPGPNDAPTRERGLLELRSPGVTAQQTDGAQLGQYLPLSEWPAELLPAGLADLGYFAAFRHDPQALTYSVAALTTRAAQSALRHGADLMLNARAYPTPGGVRLDRLNITNTHQIVVHETHQVAAQQVIIAAGAASPHLAEQHLGTVTHHGQVYCQWPRLNVSSSDLTPLIRAQFVGQFGPVPLTLRPHAGGFTVILPTHHRDPYGYQPTGGRLSGVPVGLRREALQDLLLGMDGLSLLATQALEVGRSLSDIAGAWVALPAGGWPCLEALSDKHWLLLGGEKADLLGAGVAREAALTVIDSGGWKEGSTT